MVSEQDRLAQIFIWRQASVPDIEYARQVLSIVNPPAARLISGDDPPIRLLSIFGVWPDDPWGPALLDMRARPAADGTQWNDTTQYDLAGWQGTDPRTGSRLFVVTAYRKANAPSSETFQGASTPAPSNIPPVSSVSQVPYYPQHPTGPISWPPSEQVGKRELPYQQGTGPANTAAMAYYEEGYANITGPLGNIAQPEPPREQLDPYYAGFLPRLGAWAIDLACVAIFEVGALLLYMWFTGETNPRDFGDWIGTYWGFFIIAIIIFAAYHVIQWSIWGQTLGKSLMGIKVVDLKGNKPDLGRSIARMMTYLPNLLFPIGFLQIPYNSRRQAFHDMIAETYVVPENPPGRVPAGLPGYGPSAQAQAQPGEAIYGAQSGMMPSLGMATMAGPQSYEEVRISPEKPRQAVTPLAANEQQSEEGRNIFREIASIDQSLKTVVNLPDLPDAMPSNLTGSLSTTPDLLSAGATGPLTEQALRQQADRLSSIERARELFRQGMEQMEQGVQPGVQPGEQPGEQGYQVEPSSALKAAQAFQAAAQLVPSSVIYHYFLGVALRYSAGFETAIREFRHVLELDPGHYEARQQVAYGPRWHDAFAYLPWSERHNLQPGGTVPEPILSLLPPTNQPVTRLVVLRDGSSKVVSVLGRTPRMSWARPLTPDLPTHIDMVLSRTPSGPIIALYLVVEDKASDPYKGETFLNPHDPGSPTYDACQLGQNLLSQLHRQEYTYLIFVDEENRLLMTRKLNFDPPTQININQCLYEVQTLPSQIMDPQRFQAAAEWHMEHFSLDQVK